MSVEFVRWLGRVRPAPTGKSPYTCPAMTTRDQGIPEDPDQPSAEGEAAPSFDAFLSYTTRGDYWFARRVETFLEGFHSTFGAHARGIRPLHIWRDGSDLRQSRATAADRDAVWARIEGRLAECRRLVVLCSPEAAAAPWVTREVEWMLKQRGEGAVWLALTRAEDPAGRPEEVFPDPVLARGLHRSQIWYDFRKWRGSREPGVRDPEDELVRLALDLLGVDDAEQSSLASTWRREAARRERRRAVMTTVAAVALSAAAALATVMALRARDSAQLAQAASILRTADVELDPLKGALLVRALPEKHLPSGTLSVAHRRLAEHLPIAHLRGHRRAVIAGAFVGGGRIATVDAGGTVMIRPEDGRGDGPAIQVKAPENVSAASVAPAGSSVFLAARGIGVHRVDTGTGRTSVCPIGDDARELFAGMDGRSVLVRGYSAKVHVCRFDDANVFHKAASLDAGVLAAWPAAEPGWLVLTEKGTTWAVSGNGEVHRLPDWDVEGPRGLGGDAPVAADRAPGGTRLAVGSANALLLLSDAAGRVRQKRIPLPVKPLEIRFSPDGEMLAVVTDDGIIRRYGVPDLGELPEFDGRVQYFRLDERGAGGKKPVAIEIVAVSWSPKGDFLAAIQPGKGILLWPRDGGREPERYAGHVGADRIVWPGNGARFASLGDDGTVRIWLAPGEDPVTRIQLPDYIYSGSLGADGRLFALGTAAGEIWLGDRAAPHRLDRVRYDEIAAHCPAAGKPTTVRFLAVDSSRRLLWAGFDGGVAVRWKMGFDRIRSEPRAVCTAGKLYGYAEATGVLAWVDDNGLMSSWDGEASPVTAPVPVRAKPSSLTLSADGADLAVGFEDGTVAAWSGIPKASNGRFRTWKAHAKDVYCVAPGGPDGLLLTGSQDGKARIWGPSDSTPVAEMEDTQRNLWIEQCAWGGQEAFVASSAGRLWAWRTADPRRPRLLGNTDDLAQIGSVNTLVVEPAGKQVVTGGGVDGMVRVWSRMSGELASEVNLESSVTVVSMSPNGWMLAAGEGGYVRLLPSNMSEATRALAERTSAILTWREREKLLGESSETARARYDDSERAHGRTPLPTGWQFQMPF